MRAGVTLGLMVTVLSVLALMVLVALASASSDAIAFGRSRRRPAHRPLRAEDSLRDDRTVSTGTDATSARLYDLKRYDQSGLGGL